VLGSTGKCDYVVSRYAKLFGQKPGQQNMGTKKPLMGLDLNKKRKTVRKKHEIKKGDRKT
jgi:hypothetical protein